MITAKKIEPSAWPIENRTGRSEKPMPARSHAKPVAAISIPTRLSGRRRHANRPTPMNPHPMISPTAAHAAGGSSMSLVRMTATTASPIATPAPASAHRARRKPVMGGSQKRLQRSAGKLGFGDEAPNAPDRAELGEVAARGEHDHRAESVGGGQAPGDLDPVDVGQVHVEQHDVRQEAPDSLERRLAVLGLPHHVVPLALEQHP